MSPRPQLHSTDMSDINFHNKPQLESSVFTKEAAFLNDDDFPQQTVVVLGPGGVGKTSLTIKLITDNFINYYDPTIEDCYKVAQVVDGERTFLEIIDTAGQVEYSSMQDQWVRENEAFVLVYAIDNADTLDEVQDLKTKIERCNREDGKIREIVLVGNKCDCVEERQVPFEEGQALANEWGAHFMETSAKDMTNVTECFHEAVRAIKKSKALVKEPQAKKPRRKCCLIM